MSGDTVRSEALRIDKWLWHARFARSRGKAVSLILDGAVRLNRKPVLKLSLKVTRGDLITLVIGKTVRAVEVLELGSRRGPASEARLLYKDLKAASTTDLSSELADHRPTRAKAGPNHYSIPKSKPTHA